MTDIDQHDGVGNVLAIPDNPVLTPPDGTPTDRAPVVEVNYTLAHEPGGDRCIRIADSHGGVIILTAANVHRLTLIAEPAADQVAEVRRRLGYET